MKRLLLFIIAIALATAGSLPLLAATQQSVAKPDFAFPQQVTKDAEKSLEAAIRASDNQAMLRSLIDLTLAQGMIDNDNLPAVYRRINDLCPRMTSLPVRSLTRLVQASILANIYGDNRYKYNERQLPLSPLPADWTEWSGDQFRAEIERLIDEALANSDALKSAPLADYSSLLKFDRRSEIYYPTLYDFAVNHSIDLLNANFEIPRTLSASLIDNLADFPNRPFRAFNSPVASKILNLYSDLLRFDSEKPAPRILALINCCSFITAHNYNFDYDKGSAFLKNEYEKYLPLTEYSGDILLELTANNYSDSRAYYAVVTDFLRRYPSYWRADCLKSRQFDLRQPFASLEVPAYASPKKDFIVKITNKNTRDYFINIYPLNAARDILLSSTPVFHRKMTSDKELPFSTIDSLTVTLPEAGRYLAVVSSDNAAPAGKNITRSGSVITVTSVALGSASGTESYLFSLNPETGAPIGNVELYTKNRDIETSLGTTDKNGIAKIARGSSKSGYVKYTTVYPRLNNDITGIRTSIQTPSTKSPESQLYNISFCDLPIYHPGDSINWETIIYSVAETSRYPMVDFPTRAILYNANYQPVDTLDVTTDDFGRAGGRFLIPRGELTGQYSVRFQPVDKQSATNVNLSALWFLVSDYKLPTFKVEPTKNVMNTPAKGDVTIRGRVISLSGVGLADTRVKLNLSSAQLFRFVYSGTPFYADSVTTAADGSFSIVVPDSILSYSPYPHGTFSATITATTISGESQVASTSFSRGASYSIIASLTGSDYAPGIFESSKPASLSLRVLDAKGNPVDRQVKLVVTPANHKETNRGFTSIITPATKQLDLKSLNPGVYDFTFSIADEELKALSDSVKMPYTVFRLNDSRSPSEKAVWGAVSNHNSKLKPGEKARIVYAVPRNDSHIVYLLSTGDSIIEAKWLKCKAGVHTLDIAIPAGSSSAKLSLFGCRDFSTADFSETLSLAQESLQIECESFRDKLIPGAEETWSFRILTSSGDARRTALALGMYNAALEKFNSSNWNFRFADFKTKSIYSDFQIWPSANFTHDAISSRAKNPFSCPSLLTPGFQTYGYPFVAHFRTSRIMYKTMATAGGIVENLAVARAPQAMAQTSAAADGGLALADGIDEIEGGVDDIVDTSVHNRNIELNEDLSQIETPNPSSKSEFEYRDGQTTLAFFRPQLTTDPDGTLTFSFTLPNANTTWRLNALAYTENLLSAALNRTFVANKPVMVTPNLPRFLRAGDQATISSLVVNNSDSTLTVITTTEIFNPLSGAVISSTSSTSTLAPGQNTTVTSPLLAPLDATSIGVRVKSSTPSFADGEQSLLPILPASEPVIESTPFYISPDSTSFSMTLPAVGHDARVTLEYCDNPTWYVVTALPGLQQSSPSTPADAASAIFSAAVAEGILRSNPAVAEALRQWTRSDRSDSTLVSMLQRNADLKTLLLQATPWMVDAMTDTQRMQRLALLFDKSQIADTYSRSILLLRRLQRPGGGWAWISSSDQPSEWATRQTLMTLGRLNRLGFLPADPSLRSMIQQALSWHQTQVEKDYRKYPSGSRYSFLLLRDLWPDQPLSLTGKTIIAKEIQKIVKDWKTYSISRKAQASLLLAHNGYTSLASTLLRSIEEFAKSTPEQGMWWPSVEPGSSIEQLQVSADILAALTTLQPSSPMIDPVRQWLILQKEARNWGSSDAASQVVCAILQSSQKWIAPAATTTISIDSTPIPVSPTDSRLGYLRTPISPLLSSSTPATLTIRKSAPLSPSWGAIYSRSLQPVTSIRAASCQAVSIQKQLYRLQATQWLPVNPATDSLRVGDRVAIQLLIHANRHMQYVAITDSRAACLEPVEQLPAPILSQGLSFYRENLDTSTRLFITNLPPGTYTLRYELFVTSAGTFSSGIATLQSQYAPQLTAHSAGSLLNILPQK